MKDNKFLYKEYLEVAKDLEGYNTIFQKFWGMGRPFFTKSIPTAAVGWDKNGNLDRYLFNPDFWEESDRILRSFVVAHECLHVVLDHYSRFFSQEDLTEKERKKRNIATDIVINHLLLDCMELNQSQVDPIDPETGKRKYCWINTIFKPNTVLKNKSSEYYLEMLEDENNLQFDFNKQQEVDCHIYLDKNGKISVDDFIKTIFGDMSPEEKEQIKKNILRSADIGDKNLILDVFKKKNKKWETIIKNWSLKNDNDKDEESWIFRDKKIINLPASISMPSRISVQDKNKENVFFFLDTSGSCAHLADRFWKAALSLDETKFNVNLCCFDTKVYEVNLKDKQLYGFGGTSFDIIDEYLQKTIQDKKIKKHPTVFVITDGYGNDISPKKPNMYHWFITEGGSTECIDKGCKTYDLKDFE
jgi:predicted metal-dependent peptidase